MSQLSKYLLMIKNYSKEFCLSQKCIGKKRLENINSWNVHNHKMHPVSPCLSLSPVEPMILLK